MKDLENQTKGIREFSKKRTEDALKKVELTIKELLELGEEITKYKIFKRSGLSRKFIYNNETVNEMFEKQKDKNFSKGDKEEDTLKKEIEKLKKENEELKKQYSKTKAIEKENERLNKGYNSIKKEYEILEKQFEQVCKQKGLI